ncbi:hypothetical protein Tco_1561466 [Tanacetum coccineum]
MKEMSDTLNNLVPDLTIAKTNELMKEEIPRMINDAVKRDRELSTDIVPDTSTTTTTADLKQQLYLKMKSDLQAQVVDPEMWDNLKKKFEKSSISASSCKGHGAHQCDYHPFKGEKREKRQKTSVERVLKKVKLKIFETEFLKKAPLLGEFDLDIMKAYEREITKRLRHHEQMRR